MLRSTTGLLIVLSMTLATAGLAEDVVRVFEVEELLADVGEERFSGIPLWHDDKSASHLVHVRPGGSVPDHHHPVYHEAVVVLRGELSLSLDGEEHRITAGQVLYVPAGTYIEGTNEGDEDAVFVAVFSSTGEEGPLTVRGRPDGG